MKRFLFGALACLLFFCLALGALAAEETDGEEPKNTAPSGVDTASETDATAPETSARDTSPTGDEGETTPAEEQKSAGGYILAFFETYAGELFSLLTLAGSLILMCGYKRGLLPTLYGGLNKIADYTRGVGEAASRLAEDTEGQMNDFCLRAAPILERIAAVADGADALRAQAERMKEEMDAAESERARTAALMRGVADLLYGVFSAANLPAYAKEQLGQRYAALTAIAAEAEVPHESEDL